LALVLAGSLAAGSHAAAAPARASLPAIERGVMCVTCKIPLELAQSPQADRERALIAELIGRGYDEAQIKHELVAQYGPSVLAPPPRRGSYISSGALTPSRSRHRAIVLRLAMLSAMRSDSVAAGSAPTTRQSR